MPNIFTASPPAWMESQAARFDPSEGAQVLGEGFSLTAGSAIRSAIGTKDPDTGETVHQNFFDVFKDAYNTMRDPFYMEKAEAMRANAELTHATTADKLLGMKEYPEWMKETGGDPDKMRSTPWTGSSQYGSQLYDNQMKNLWMKDYHDQIVETKQQDALNKLQSEKDRVKSEADKLEETKSNNAIRAGIAQDRADTYKGKNQYFKSGSDIYKVNPDTQELEKVVTGKDSKVSADDSLELLNKRTMLQSKLESLTRGGGFGIHWNKTLKPDDQKTVAIYQKQIDDINQKLGMGSDESGTQGGSEAPVTSRFKILEVK